MLLDEVDLADREKAGEEEGRDEGRRRRTGPSCSGSCCCGCLLRGCREAVSAASHEAEDPTSR